MRILLILTFLLFSSCLYSQEEHLALQNERIYQLGGYYGNGYTPWIKEANPMYYLGIRAHLPYKKHRFRRSEVYLQFSGIFSSNKSSINENPSSYNNVRQTIRKDQSVFADIGTKIQFKAVNYYRFRFYVSPFIGAGWVLYTGASITKHIYNDPSNNSSDYYVEKKNYNFYSQIGGSGFTFNFGLSLDHEFRLSENMFLNVDIQPLRPTLIPASPTILNWKGRLELYITIGVSWKIKERED